MDEEKVQELEDKVTALEDRIESLEKENEELRAAAAKLANVVEDVISDTDSAMLTARSTMGSILRDAGLD